MMHVVFCIGVYNMCGHRAALRESGQIMERFFICVYIVLFQRVIEKKTVSILHNNILMDATKNNQASSSIINIVRRYISK